jgi:predicted phosphodiesterase
MSRKMSGSWGLIADVHGNLPALDKALRVLEAAGAQQFAFLGDYLGRGDSDACARRIQQVGTVAVVGNRDLDWQDRVTPETRAWVRALPRSIAIGPLLLAHGDARLTRAMSTAQINRDFRDAWAALSDHDAIVLAFGHSHYARTWRKRSATTPAELLIGHRIDLEPECRYIVNVGTTGLPFPGKGQPSVALVDFAESQVRHLVLE